MVQPFFDQVPNKGSALGIHVSRGPKWKNPVSGVPILVVSTASHETYYNLPYLALCTQKDRKESDLVSVVSLKNIFFKVIECCYTQYSCNNIITTLIQILPFLFWLFLQN